MILVDFIVELPEAHGYDVVMVAVDSVGKRAHFIPTHTTITAQEAVDLFLRNVWKLMVSPAISSLIESHSSSLSSPGNCTNS
jgi:hypothetical protein